MNNLDAKSSFILHWGDMGAQWGVNRSIAQIHALLYLSATPLNAEVISDHLGIARSNVSNSLKELLGWQLIRRVPIAGDRREHFVAEADPWEIATLIAKGRKEREIDPALKALETCLLLADEETDLDPVAKKRMQDMHDFLTTMDRWYIQMMQVPKSKLAALIRMGSKVISLISVGTARG